MRPTKGQIVIVGIVLAIILALVLLFSGLIPGLRSTTKQNAVSGALTVWGVFDSGEVMTETLIADFNAAYPGVAISYRQIDERNYEQDLVNALAAGEGPDVFMIHNTWLAKHYSKIRPFTDLEFSTKMLSEIFPQVVLKDFVKDGAVYALPLYIDSLALYYNQNMLDNAGIAEPPKTWGELVEMIPRLRKVDQLGRIEQAAVALGGSEKNINQASDLLALLMFQEETPMVSDTGTEALFSSTPGLKALNFYTSFANPRNTQYTWDPGFVYSLDGFVQEDIAMIFSYGYQAEILRQRNPFLNFAIVPMLQKSVDGDIVNYADYWGFAIAKSSTQTEAANLFTIFTTTSGTAQTNYLNRTNRSPALRSIIRNVTQDPELRIFAGQALTANSWPQPDASAVESIFSEMIDLVITGRLPADRALRQGDEKVTELLRRAAGEE